jgi:hypothetical protein
VALAHSPEPQTKKRDWDLHVNLVAWLFIAQATLSAVAGIAIVVIGRIVSHFLLVFPDAPPPEVIQMISAISFVIGVAFVVLAIPSIASGVGLLYYRNWGRVLTLALSFLKILEFPFGTATSIYAFWVLLSQGGRSYFRSRAEQAG